MSKNIGGFRVAVFVVLAFILSSFQMAQAQTNNERPGANKEVERKAIGKLILSKGVVTSSSPEQSAFLLSKGSDVFLNDKIITANKSFAVIRFNDGGKTTIRPNTELVLSDYSEKKGSERKTIEVLKGGLRSITGAIGKARPKHVKYRARNLTIGIRGTEFVIVICDNGVCETDGEKAAQTLSDGPESGTLEDIFVRNKKTGEKVKLTRQEFRDSLEGIYLSVQDGAISLESDEWIIDMPAGESCLAGSGDIECFKPGVVLEDLDEHLNGNIEKIYLIDLRGTDSSDVDNSVICEIL